MVELREITKDNLNAVLDLKVSEYQKDFVSSTAYSLAQAYVYGKNAYPFAVYSENIPIGFVMLGFYQEKNQYTLWKFLIDEKYQNKGYGKEALRLAINFLKAKYKVKSVFAGVSPQNTVARALYKSFGFKETGVFDAYQLELILEI